MKALESVITEIKNEVKTAALEIWQLKSLVIGLLNLVIFATTVIL